ncbi:MAG: hypothetical protein NTV52_01820 [Acidobacteria bacterium]|nr:hypothetical protein [Acidobacteriota bacterium]
MTFAIQPGLVDEFGDMFEIDYREAASLPIAVPHFFVNGHRKTTVSGVATDELYATLSAAIEAAHSPAM